MPVVADGVVYTFGAEGQLHAIDLAKGTRIWSVDTMQRFEVPKGFFGAAGSPLVEDGRVHRQRRRAEGGHRRVRGEDRKSPVDRDRRRGELFVAGGRDDRRTTLRDFLYARGARRPGCRRPGRSCFSVRGARGSPRRSTPPRPLVVGDLIFRVGRSTGPGAGVLRLEGSTLTPLWTSDEALSNHYATSVHRDGILYGFHGRQEFGQSFRAVELRTGKVRWSEERFGAGTVTLAGDRLVILRENGELVLAAASPDGFKPLARAQILTGTVRAYPALV